MSESHSIPPSAPCHLPYEVEDDAPLEVLPEPLADQDTGPPDPNDWPPEGDAQQYRDERELSARPLAALLQAEARLQELVWLGKLWTSHVDALGAQLTALRHDLERQG